MLRLLLVVALGAGATAGLKIDRALAPGRCERAGGDYDVTRHLCLGVAR